MRLATQSSATRSLIALSALVSATLSACGPTADAQAPVAAFVAPATPIQRCINMGGALEAPEEGDWGPVITRSDISAIKAEGFDTLRLPVAWSEHLDTADTIDPAFLARVDEVIGWALDEGLRVVLDVHHFWDLNENPRANIPRLHRIWAQLAAHYADWPDGLIFELINEPHDKFTQDLVNAFNQEALAGIRRSNPDRWVILGGASWGGITPFTATADVPFEPVADPRAIATFHSYSPYDFTHQGVTFADDPPPAGRPFDLDLDRDVIRGEMRDAQDFMRRTGMPMLLGEFGAYRQIPHGERLLWTETMRREAEAHGIAWCYFDWQTEFRYADPDTDRPLPGMRGALFGR